MTKKVEEVPEEEDPKKMTEEQIYAKKFQEEEKGQDEDYLLSEAQK